MSCSPAAPLTTHRVPVAKPSYWKPRFITGGYAALVGFASAAPKHPARTDAAIEAQIVALRTAHPTWSKRRIADELSKGNAWQRVVSANTVARILCDHALWTATAKNDPSGP